MKKIIAKVHFTHAKSDVRTLAEVMLESGEIETADAVRRCGETDQYCYTVMEKQYELDTGGPYIHTKGFDTPEHDPLLQLPII